MQERATGLPTAPFASRRRTGMARARQRRWRRSNKGVLHSVDDRLSVMPGRNDPCPCGSGKKFKKCHGDPKRDRSPRPLPPEVQRALAGQQARMRRHEAEFGRIREIVSTDFAGRKIVAVGRRLYWSEKWKTVPDFLSHYMKTKVPEAWYKAELEQPLERRHPIAQWYWRYCEFQSRHQDRGPDGLFHGEPDAPSMAYLVLAHELYVLEDNMVLQEKLISRLLRPDHFQSARYEISVAAAMIRAGFTLEMEDEDDPRTTHPEFVATHTRTGIRVAVEAKSRRRGGVLGQPGELNIKDNLANDVRRLFRDALRKANDRPLFVFVDANLPPAAAADMAPRWQVQFSRMVAEEATRIDETGAIGLHAHNLLLVSNVGYHYGEPGEVPPDGLFYCHWPQPEFCQHPVEPRIIRDVEESMKLHGRIPQSFDD